MRPFVTFRIIVDLHRKTFGEWCHKLENISNTLSLKWIFLLVMCRNVKFFNIPYYTCQSFHSCYMEKNGPVRVGLTSSGLHITNWKFRKWAPQIVCISRHVRTASGPVAFPQPQTAITSPLTRPNDQSSTSFLFFLRPLHMHHNIPSFPDSLSARSARAAWSYHLKSLLSRSTSGRTALVFESKRTKKEVRVNQLLCVMCLLMDSLIRFGLVVMVLMLGPWMNGSFLHSM